MAFKCDNCGKSILWGHRVSHAKNRTNHAFKPNIQKKRVVINGVSRRVKLCANCIRTLRKVKKAKVTPEQTTISTPTL
jgi:large subunit ribosomal protein L28